MLNDLAKQCYETAKSKGWHESDRGFPETVALIHSEVSEALAEFRDGHEPAEVYIKDGKPEGIPIELADVIIRILDACGNYGIDIDEAIEIKMKFNKNRPYRHGGKKA